MDAEAVEYLHVFLWHALANHPHIRRLMQVLGHGPLPWTQVATHPELWPVPRSLDGDVDTEELPRVLKALSNLIQIVTCARRSPDEQPLIPIRLHLLYLVASTLVVQDLQQARRPLATLWVTESFIWNVGPNASRAQRQCWSCHHAASVARCSQSPYVKTIC